MQYVKAQWFFNVSIKSSFISLLINGELYYKGFIYICNQLFIWYVSILKSLLLLHRVSLDNIRKLKLM